jgi:hypothetical protein
MTQVLYCEEAEDSENNRPQLLSVMPLRELVGGQPIGMPRGRYGWEGRGNLSESRYLADYHTSPGRTVAFLWLIMAGLSLLAFDTSYKLLAMLFVAMSWLFRSYRSAVRLWPGGSIGMASNGVP